MVVDDVEDHRQAERRGRRRRASAGRAGRRRRTGSRSGRRRRSPSRARPGNSATGISSIVVTPELGELGEVRDRALEGPLGRERADVQLVDDAVGQPARGSRRRSTRSRAGRRPATGPRRPSGCQREHGSGSADAVEHEHVVVARRRRRRWPRRCRSRRARARARGRRRAGRISSGFGAQTRNSVRPVRSGNAPSRRWKGNSSMWDNPDRSQRRSGPKTRQGNALIRSVRRSMKAAASTSVATWALAAWPVRLSWSTTVRPRHGPWVTSISTGRCSVRDDVGLDHVGDGERVVDGRVAVAVDALVELAVEGVQVGDDGAGVAARAQRLGALRPRASRGG